MTDYEARARAVKASRLLHVLDRVAAEMNWTPDELIAAAEDANEVARAKVARMAQCKVPSDATWGIVCGLLRARLTAPADPFQGVAR